MNGKALSQPYGTGTSVTLGPLNETGRGECRAVLARFSKLKECLFQIIVLIFKRITTNIDLSLYNFEIIIGVLKNGS